MGKGEGRGEIVEGLRIGVDDLDGVICVMGNWERGEIGRRGLMEEL